MSPSISDPITKVRANHSCLCSTGLPATRTKEELGSSTEDTTCACARRPASSRIRRNKRTSFFPLSFSPGVMRVSSSLNAFEVPQYSHLRVVVPGAKESFAPQPAQGKVFTKTGDRPRFSSETGDRPRFSTCAASDIIVTPEKRGLSPVFLTAEREAVPPRTGTRARARHPPWPTAPCRPSTRAWRA